MTAASDAAAEISVRELKTPLWMQMIIDKHMRSERHAAAELRRAAELLFCLVRDDDDPFDNRIAVVKNDAALLMENLQRALQSYDEEKPRI